MTIIKQGVSKVGEFWQKKVFTHTIDDNGVEQVLAALAFPGYTWPGYLWMKWSVMSIAEMDPWATSEFNMKGRHVNIPESVAFADNPQTLMQTYAPVDDTAAGGAAMSDVDDYANTDITGGLEGQFPPSKRYTFLNREYRFGLPNGAYPCNANKIRYTAFGNYKGHCRTDNMVDVAQPHMIFLGGLTEAPVTSSTNYSQALYGDHSDWGNLYSALVDSVSRTPTPGTDDDQTSDEYITATLQNFQGKGFQVDDASETAAPADVLNDADLYIKLDLTCRLDVYAPDSRTRVLAP